ncbi:Cadherin-like protein 26 [Acipenser ruthenus]|uniref:Cadherin-like protein 26 n=1 Tax=Acipenser ruthenus TaxID=7906 RepID=A0A444UX90_ACIRT|nr:Cadherin-like protein 26 [Acipenser ruthenus]
MHFKWYIKMLTSIRFDVADRRTGKIVDQSLVFNIDVKDKNDNAPKFKNPVVDVLLKENSPAGSDVFLLQAEDIDQRGTPNSEFSYSVVSQEPPSTKSQFSINPNNGIVSFEGCLDYQSTKSYKILVEAKDHGEPQLSSTATMNIKIEDANNNPPVFVKKEFTGNVKEQQVGVSVLRVSVEDKDTPNTPAWRAKYTVTKGNEDGNYKIETDPQTNDGILTVIKPLDYEKGSRNDLEISVENEEPLYICPGAGGSAPTAGGSVPTAGGYRVPVVVNVEDVNDPPSFERSKITVYQTEGTKVPIQLCKVHAVDPEAAHSTLRYEIPAGGDPAKWLTVDKNTGEVTAIAEMDRESPYVNNSIYSVIVLAVDDGKPPQTGTATVLIHLTDVNDNNPFLDSKYVHMCDDPKNTSIVVKATDKDIEPYSGPFIFQLLDKGNDVTNTWKLEQLQGESIKLLRLRELPTGNYTVPLKIIDQQGLATEEDLMLRICECSQEGVCRPLEAQSTSFGGAAIGALIGALLLMLLLLLCCVRCECSGKKISEFPPDTVDEGNQTLIKYNDEGGGCRSQPLDYEKGSRNDLEISVENEEPLYICPGAGGSAPTAGGSVPTAGGYRVPVVVNVEDVNDPPSFERSKITVYQTEGTKVPIQLCKVHAVDPEAAHSTLRYEIPAGGDPAKWLTVDKNTGEVTAIAEMDRESPYVNNSIYSVIVLAVDDGKPPQTGTATVLIHLTDVNDNNPFLDSKYVHMCDDPKNTSIVVKATDKDIEPYSGPFIFQLLDKGNDVTNTWKLEQLQGESIKLLRLRELPTGNYTVPLKIIDQQGLATEEDLMLRICECSQEGVCRPLEAQSTSFGGAAIGALIGALLLMLCK